MRLSTPDAPLSPASLQDRVLAFLVDAAITAGGIFVALIGTAKSNSEGDQGSAAFGFFFYLSVTVLLIPVGMALGGTLGQRIVGLRIVRASNGARPGFVRGFARWLVAIFGAALLFAGYWPMLTGRPSWHDRVTGTMVVHVKRTPSGAPPPFWSQN
jgi:uncharacterized RDD family membrane protein YckC